MPSAHEKRRSNRFSIEAPILCSYFNLPSSTVVTGRVSNFSQDGMYFISDTEFFPGSAVLIRAKNDSPHQKLPENMEGYRQTTLAEVRWCRQLSEKPTLYQVGVKYYESWY